MDAQPRGAEGGAVGRSYGDAEATREAENADALCRPAAVGYTYPVIGLQRREELSYL